MATSRSIRLLMFSDPDGVSLHSRSSFAHEHLARATFRCPRCSPARPNPDTSRVPFSVMEFIEGESPDLRKVDEWPRWRDDAIVTLHACDEAWRNEALAAMRRAVGEAATIQLEVIDGHLPSAE